MFTVDNVHAAGQLLDELHEMVTDLTIMQLLDARLVLPDPTVLATKIMPSLAAGIDAHTTTPMSAADVAVFNVIESVTEFVFGAVREVIRINQEAADDES